MFSMLKEEKLHCWLLTLHGKYWSSCFPMPRHPLTFLPQTNSSPRSENNIHVANNSALYLHGCWPGNRLDLIPTWLCKQVFSGECVLAYLKCLKTTQYLISWVNLQANVMFSLKFLPVTAAKWLSPQRMDETFTLGLNSDLPKNVAGTLSGTADSESFGPFPRIPKPQTNTSPSSTEIKLFNS